jgi:hypothetical protein
MTMIEKHEEQVLTVINQMAQVMGDPSYVSAYPALHGMFVSMRMGLDALTGTILGSMRREAVHGMDQAAMLYKIVTGKSAGIPEGFIENFNPLNGISSYPKRTVSGIVNYAKKWHGLDNEILTFNQNGTIAEYNTEDNSVKVLFEGSDAYLVLESADSNRAKFHSPLMYEPLTISVNVLWMEQTFSKPLIDLLCVQEHIVDDSKEVLGNLWDTPDAHFKTREMPEAGTQLKVLLSGRMYGRACRGFCRFNFNGYQFTLETEECWEPTRHHKFKITTVTMVDGGSTVYQWYHNPILVMDLRDNIEHIMKDLLDKHELEMKEES